jgi:hypothetical protein
MFNASPREIAKTAKTGEKLPAPQLAIHGTIRGRSPKKRPERQPSVERETPTEQDIHLTETASLYEIGNIKDKMLWDAFRDEFDSWTEDEFRKCNKLALHKFRQFLQERGVWVSNIPGISPAGLLYDVLQETTPTEWTEHDVREHIKYGGRFI